MRSAKNFRPPGGGGFNYRCLLQDKFLFGQHVSSLGFPTTENLALVNRDSLTWLADMTALPFEALLHDGRAFDGFASRCRASRASARFPSS